MKRHGRILIQHLNDLGFEHVWTNSGGYPCYVHPDDPEQTEVSVSPGLGSDQVLKVAMRRAEKIAGVQASTAGKRRAGQLKERAEAQRERARRRLAFVQAKQQRLCADRAADPVTVAAVRDLIARRERELAAIEHLMRQAPQGGNAHRGTGQPRHYAPRT